MRLLGLETRLAPQDLPEEQFVLSEPILAAANVALAKSRACGGSLAADELAVAADSMVVVDGRILAKPADAAEARGMLADLRGRAHSVMTGVALRTVAGREWTATVETTVHMRAYGEDEVEQYVARGEPFDKAGGYAVQDRLFRPVECFEGCYLNVVGLPLCAVSSGLAALGVAVPEPPGDLRPPCRYCSAGDALVGIGDSSPSPR